MIQVQSAVKPEEKNGTAKNTGAAAPLKVVKDEPKMLAPKSETAAEPKPEAKREGGVKTVKEIIEKNLRMTSLMERHEILNETSKKLDSFRFGSNRLSDTLQIRDGEGNEFKTNNTAIISKVVEMVKVEVDLKFDEVEIEIRLLEAA